MYLLCVKEREGEKVVWNVSVVIDRRQEKREEADWSCAAIAVLAISLD